jgi:hypothetical protein
VAQNLAPYGELRVNSLAQPQLRAAYSSLLLQSRVLRSRSGNGIWRGQDLGMDSGISQRDICPRTNLGCYKSLMVRSGKGY